MAALTPRWRLPLATCTGLLALVVMLGCSTTVAQSDSDPPATIAPTSSTSTAADQAPRCIHGCERWGKRCNIDPRGVYKCQRVCEKFGEICE